VVLPRSRVFDDEWLAAHQMFHQVDDPSLGTCTVLGGVAHLPGSTGGWAGRSAPALGEHTIDILRAVGYDNGQIDELIRSRVVRAADPASTTHAADLGDVDTPPPT
jgi:crotonobetainyl-CoA:carnitine CoA-transferase CaiB-like acyl-CoA transferase